MTEEWTVCYLLALLTLDRLKMLGLILYNQGKICHVNSKYLAQTLFRIKQELTLPCKRPSFKMMHA